MTSSTRPAHALHILVSGGGIAGNAVALQLLRAGARVTVVERATAPRPGGQAVDLRSASRQAAERMKLMPGIREYQLDERGMSYVDGRGREYARLSMEAFDGKGPVADIEISRGDLNRVLLDAVAAAELESREPESGQSRLDYRYGDAIERLTQDGTGAEVTFTSGRTAHVDLVLGADGIHSVTRRLAFGPESEFATYLGGYASFFTMPTPAGVEPGWFVMHSVPGAAIAIRPDRNPATAKAILTLRTGEDPALRGDIAAQQRLIRHMLGGAGWRAPEILRAMDDADDFYFDVLSRIDMPQLYTGRVALLGDAGYCGSPMTGMGTAMALVGAYVLAGEIAATPADPAAALVRYHRRVTPFLDRAKQLPGGGIRTMLPNSTVGAIFSRIGMQVIMSRALRPIATKMIFGGTDDYTLPVY